MKSKLSGEFIRQLREQGIFDFQDKTLPSFKLKQINGSEFASKNLNGKPTLINFWFTSCAPCIEEIPLLNRIRQSYSDEMNFIAITYESRDEIASFLERKPFDFIQIVEARDFLKQLDIKTYPRTLIVDQNLIVRYINQSKPKDLVQFELELLNQIEIILQR